MVGGEIATVAAWGGGSFLCCKCVILYQSTAGVHMMMSNRYALILQPLSCSDSSVNYPKFVNVYGVPLRIIAQCITVIVLIVYYN